MALKYPEVVTDMSQTHLWMQANGIEGPHDESASVVEAVYKILQDTPHMVSYNSIVENIIKLIRHKNPDVVLDANQIPMEHVTGNILTDLMHHYTGEKWKLCAVNVMKIDVAQAVGIFHQLSDYLVATKTHFLTVRDGVCLDIQNSRKHRAYYLICRASETHMIDSTINVAFYMNNVLYRPKRPAHAHN